MPPEIDERTIERIADRVAAALRAELESLAAAMAAGERPLTVEQVAERFGVARSTVYAHWREWGGYKLGEGDKAPLRFDDGVVSNLRLQLSGAGDAPTRQRARRDLLADNPKGERSLERAP